MAEEGWGGGGLDKKQKKEREIKQQFPNRLPCMGLQSTA